MFCHIGGAVAIYRENWIIETVSHLISHAHLSNQTKMELGLYISKNIIEKHEGKVWAENNTNREKGATFGFSLPLTN